MGDIQEFIEAVVRVKTLFSLARSVVIRHRNAPLFKQAFMRLFFHANRGAQLDCILNSAMSLRFVSIMQQMLQHVTLTRCEWKYLAVRLCNQHSNPVVNNNKIAVNIVSAALHAKLINADDLFATLVPNYESFEHPDLCRLVVHHMRTAPTDAQQQWILDNLDNELVLIINERSCIYDEPQGDESEEVSAHPELRTATIMKLVAPFIMQIMEELYKDISLNSDLFIALRQHFPSIFVVNSSLANTIAIGIDDFINPQLHIRYNCIQVVVGADSPQRVSDIIRRLLDLKRYVSAKWILQHVPFDEGVLLRGISTNNNYQLELIGHQTGMIITRNMQTPSSSSVLWRHMFDTRIAAHNIQRLPELLLMGERLLINEYCQLCVWPSQRTLEDGRVFALWEGILGAMDLVKKHIANRFCGNTWKIVCHYALPNLAGDISMCIA